MGFGSSKRGEFSTKNGPGPGAYNPHLYTKLPYISMSLSNRPQENLNNGPGVGSYNLGFAHKKRQLPITISERYNIPGLKTHDVGPGQYNPYSDQNDAKAASLYSKLPINKQQSVGPGPAAYDIRGSPIDLSSAPLISNSDRFKMLDKDNVPGPGRYHYELLNTSIPIRFPSSQRQKFKDQGFNVGPGQYFQDNTSLNDSGITLKKRWNDQQSLITQTGPGQYNPILQNQSINYNMTNSQRMNLSPTKESPGPGAYNLDISLTKPNPKKITISTKHQRAGSYNEYPGPGQYNTDKSFDIGPSFSLRPGYTKIKNQKVVPGVGTYNLIATDIIGVHQGTANLNMSGRTQQKFDNSTGPGQYNIQSKAQGPWISFTQTKR